MDLTEYYAILIALCPTISVIITTIGAIVALIKSIKAIKEESSDKIAKAMEGVKDQQKQISRMASKLASIEKIMLEERDRR